MTSNRIPPSTVATRLQSAREWRGLSQADLAHAIDVGRTTISNYEHGITHPSRLQINAWAELCDVDPRWIRTGHTTEHTARITRIGPRRPTPTETLAELIYPAAWG
jgi:transcriptional regulator with XRE-family HTH domain